MYKPLSVELAAAERLRNLAWLTPAGGGVRFDLAAGDNHRVVMSAARPAA